MPLWCFCDKDHSNYSFGGIQYLHICSFSVINEALLLIWSWHPMNMDMTPALKCSGCTAKCQTVALPPHALEILSHRPLDLIWHLQKCWRLHLPCWRTAKSTGSLQVSGFSKAACNSSAHLQARSSPDIFSVCLC